jgi:regulator of protease activity HflC (stomatin/prohibitin superfamily)
MMMKRIDVRQNERVIVLVNGRAVRWLGPGRYWQVTLFRAVELKRLATEHVLAVLDEDEAKLAPAAELERVDLEAHERALVWRKGRPVRWLGAGQTFVWKTDPTVKVEVLDTGGVATAPLATLTAAIVPATDYREVTVPAGCVAVRYVDGALDEILGPGRHAVWTTMRKVELAVLDMRERVLAVTGQDVMTKDRVTLRLNVAATFRIADARLVATVTTNADEALYLAVQVAVRDAVTTKTLDELLAAREALTEEITDAVRTRAEPVGLKVERVALKDVVLPGDMKELLNKVIEAKKEAEANVILRREEAAATRLQAQTADMLADKPALMRLKELDAMKELAERVGQVHIVLGDNGIPQLQLNTR